MESHYGTASRNDAGKRVLEFADHHEPVDAFPLHVAGT